VDVVLLDDHVSEIDADPKVDPLIIRDESVPFGHTSLELDRASDGFDHTRELHQQTITRRFDDAALVFGYLGIDEFASLASEPRESAGLVLFHKAAISGDIGR
jgi:hypothetical protein